MSTAIGIWLGGIVVGWLAALAVEFVRPTVSEPEDAAVLVLWPIAVPLAIAFVVAGWAEDMRR